MAERSTHLADVSHFPNNFWVELLVPAFDVPNAYTPPAAVVPKTKPSLVWGRDKVPEALAIFPGFGAGLVHALHTYTTTGNIEGLDGFGGMFRLLNHGTILVGIRELKEAKMVPAMLPETAGTRWRKINEYIPRARTLTPAPADPPASTCVTPIIPISAPLLAPTVPILPPPARKVTTPARVTTPISLTPPLAQPAAAGNAADLFDDESPTTVTATPERDLFDEFDDEDMYDDWEITPTGALPGLSLGKGQENGGEGVFLEQDGDVRVMTPDEGDKESILTLVTSSEKELLPLRSPLPTEIPTPAASINDGDLFSEELASPRTQDDVHNLDDDPDPEDNGPVTRSDAAAPMTPRSEGSNSNVLGSSLFSDEEEDSKETDMNTDDDPKDDGPVTRSDAAAPMTPRSEGSNSNVLGSSLFSDEEEDCEETDMDTYITTLMSVIRGTPDYARIVKDMETVASSRMGSQIPVPKLKRRIQKRSRSTATSAEVSPAAGRVNKKMRESTG